MNQQSIIDELANDIVGAAKKTLVNKLAVYPNPLDAMKSVAKDLVKLGLPVELAVVSVKIILQDIGNDLQLESPFDSNELLKELEKYM